jgi:hypothetical protein
MQPQGQAIRARLTTKGYGSAWRRGAEGEAGAAAHPQVTLQQGRQHTWAPFACDCGITVTGSLCRCSYVKLLVLHADRL